MYHKNIHQAGTHPPVRGLFMRYQFTKMHGIGNDYIYLDCLQGHVPPDPAALSVWVSDRHKGVGSDGLVLILPSASADFRMRIFNADGSEAMMCGNATRCIGKYVYDGGLTAKTSLTLETNSGIKALTLFPENGRVRQVSVDMGSPVLAPRSIPMAADGESWVDQPFACAGRAWRCTAVSMGNPHCVTFVEDPDALELEAIGPLFERDPLFPARVNAEFVRVLDSRTLQMRVWERGSGETMACGTGACASAVAAVLCGRCPRGQEILLHLRGGDLAVTWTQAGSVIMKGPAETVCDGTFEFPPLP